VHILKEGNASPKKKVSRKKRREGTKIIRVDLLGGRVLKRGYSTALPEKKKGEWSAKDLAFAGTPFLPPQKKGELAASGGKRRRELRRKILCAGRRARSRGKCQVITRRAHAARKGEEIMEPDRSYEDQKAAFRKKRRRESSGLYSVRVGKKKVVV